MAYAYDAAANLHTRSNNNYGQIFDVNSLNELIAGSRLGYYTVAGTTSSPATNVTVNTSNAILYADNTFARTNVGLADGTNTWTAVAKDNLGRVDSNTVVAYLPSASYFSYDL